jgi:hypothetical protein
MKRTRDLLRLASVPIKRRPPLSLFFGPPNSSGEFWSAAKWISLGRNKAIFPTAMVHRE